MRRAKIVCTLGPASSSIRVIEDLVEAGMAVARINASHTDAERISTIAHTVREVDSRVEVPVATMLDLQGPEIRTLPADEPVNLTAGASVAFQPGGRTDAGVIGLSRAIRNVRRGDRILIDDGRIACTVAAVDGETVTAEVEIGGILGDRKGINVPGVDLDLPMVTEKDREDLSVLTEGTIDFVAASFVRDEEDVLEVNAAIEALDCDVPIIAKIERADAVENLADILDTTYGVMVARGDLGVECPLEQIPMMQKRIIRRCREDGIPVITATEMLDSMVSARRPTRAEASDVANAVLDGTDAVMLSEETAVGDHPVRVVEAMDGIVREVEASDEYAELREQRIPPAARSRTDALARAGRYYARDIGAHVLIATSETGYTARKAAKYRPAMPIVAGTLSERISRRLTISWGLQPYLIDPSEPTATELIEEAVSVTLEHDLAESGDTVVVITGMMREIEGAEFTNTLKVHVAAETVTTGRVVVGGVVTGPLWFTDDGDVSEIEPGSILVIDDDFDAEIRGDLDAIAGIVSAEDGLTGYVAMIAREMGVPMISSAAVPASIEAGRIVTLDAERGVLYGGDISTPSLMEERSQTDPAIRLDR